MGITVTVAVAESVLTDDQLSRLGFRSLGLEVTSEDVATVPGDERACVIRTRSSTIIVDGGERLMDAIDQSRIDLPGTVHFGCTVPSVDFSDYRVVVDGTPVRRLRQEEGEITVDDGAESPAESVFRIPGDDDSDPEMDGDILVQSLGSVSGVAPDVDVLELTGVAYESSTNGGASNSSSGGAPAAAAKAQKKRWSVGRLFGALGN
ncbi:hypothetical protein [Gordonia sp. (in: high G+C Gram-positive bacteria)]|uniref:hypothetical protein n=1 Tax=Gordonia sp. (in: high G+C Gram-positive bacteria) TaxID=84139 RepID=UPI003F9E2D5A